MRDYSAVHNQDWLEDISAGENPNSVTITVRQLDGKKVRFHLATRPLLERIKQVEAAQKKKKQD